MVFRAVLVLIERLLGPKRTIGPTLSQFRRSLGDTKGQTVCLMTSPELQVSVSLPRVVDRVPICDLGQKRSWILCQWVKCEAVECEDDQLLFTCQELSRKTWSLD